jgi:hypothetical protein
MINEENDNYRNGTVVPDGDERGNYEGEQRIFKSKDSKISKRRTDNCNGGNIINAF